MVILHNKSATKRSTITVPSSSAIINGTHDKDISYSSAIRGGLSNDATALLGLNDIGGENLEDDSTDSILNSHRRSRS
jgi:hypothetical protein